MFNPMDKSRQYIQMCKTSKEIQSKWLQTPGDLFVNINNKISFWTTQSSNSFTIKNGFKIGKENELITIEKFFWLPSLDQLLETAQIKGKSYRDTTFDFFEWTKQKYSQDSKSADSIFGSLEQLWLGYVMEKKFSKKWVNDIWRDI